MKFEEALKRLNEIVQKLESPELTLEESIKLYQEGTELSVFCKKELDNAKLVISQYNNTTE